MERSTPNGTRPTPGNWYVEEQRYGADLINGAIGVHDKAALERGLLILRWGFEQQQPDGGFRCPDAFHSTSFFVEATAHSLLMIQASDYAADYRETIAQMQPKLLASACSGRGSRSRGERVR